MAARHARPARLRLSGLITGTALVLALASASICYLTRPATGPTRPPVQVAAVTVAWPAGAAYTPGLWAQVFLTAAGLPTGACDLAAVTAWQTAEGSAPAWDNPLDTTLAVPGVSVPVPGNPAGVQQYPDEATGIAQTVTTLLDSSPSFGYAPIVAALQADDNAQAVADAVAASHWGTLPFTASCAGSSPAPAPAPTPTLYGF